MIVVRDRGLFGARAAFAAIAALVLFLQAAAFAQSSFGGRAPHPASGAPDASLCRAAAAPGSADPAQGRRHCAEDCILCAAGHRDDASPAVAVSPAAGPLARVAVAFRARFARAAALPARRAPRPWSPRAPPAVG
jgi:hypothetical protein